MMPILPSTWHYGFPITAHQLNQDLYTYDGSYFGANGVMFHSNRPLMIEAYLNSDSQANTGSGGNFTSLGGTAASAISICDTSALYGTGSDGPGAFARFQSSGAVAPGSSGSPGDPGGWQLMFTFIPVLPSFSSTVSTYGVFWNLSADAKHLINNPLQDIGCMQPGNTQFGVCGFALDLIQRTPTAPDQVYAPGLFLVDPSGAPLNINAGGSACTGVTPRFAEIWMGVTNGNGQTVSGIPTPMTSVSTTTTFSSAALNSTIQNTFNLLNSPPMLNCQVQSTVAITANNTTTVPFTMTPLVDSYSGYSTHATTYTVPLTGIYLMHANIIYSSAWNVGQAVVGFQVTASTTGTYTLWGGSYNATPSSSQNTGASVTKVLDLVQGDTVKVITKTSTNSNFGTANVSHFIMTWLTGAATSKQTWVPPDVTGFLFGAATPPGAGSNQLVSLMNTKIANDINFLLNRPYLTVYQTAAQSLVAGNGTNVFLGSGSTFHPVTMQSTVGLVHGSYGDNYGGWNAATNQYVAPVNGWYLAVAEVNCATTSTANSYNQLVAGFSVPTSGGMAYQTVSSNFSYSFNQPGTDWYQELNVSNAWTYPTGATAMNVYYLLAGETIAPVAQYLAHSTPYTASTDVSHGFNSHFNVVWLSN
jgi:hypothetical protein